MKVKDGFSQVAVLGFSFILCPAAVACSGSHGSTSTQASAPLSAGTPGARMAMDRLNAHDQAGAAAVMGPVGTPVTPSGAAAVKGKEEASNADGDEDQDSDEHDGDDDSDEQNED